MKNIVDARGLACPQPVINTRKAVEEGGFDRLEVIVDNEAARENVNRFLKKSGFTDIRVIKEGNDFRLVVETVVSKSGDQKEQVKKGNTRNENSAKTIFIGRNMIGSGSDELGEKLMTAFIYTLTETTNPPARLIFMNSGVRLCVEGSEALENLIKLDKRNIEILVCGTCLNYFHLAEKLKVGRISNMYDIVEYLLDKGSVLCI